LCHCERFQERSQPNATDEDGLFHGLTSSLGPQASSVPTCSVQVRLHLVSYLVSLFHHRNGRQSQRQKNNTVLTTITLTLMTKQLRKTIE